MSLEIAHALGALALATAAGQVRLLVTLQRRLQRACGSMNRKVMRWLAYAARRLQYPEVGGEPGISGHAWG